MHPPEQTIQIGNEEIVVRPSLRAACLLDKRHGGFEPLARAVIDGTVGTIADVIAAGSIDHRSKTELETALAHNLKSLNIIIPNVLSFVLALVGIDDAKAVSSDAKPTQTAGKLIPFAEHHAKLFRIATGWLGWTPQQAWDSTPQEIMEAYKGRAELLQAIFGGGEKQEAEGTGEYDPGYFDQEGLNALRGLQ